MFEMATDLNSRNVRQHEVEQNEVWSGFAHRGQRIRPAVCGQNLVSRLAEVVGEDLANILFVFDNQNACHGNCRKSTRSVRAHF